VLKALVALTFIVGVHAEALAWGDRGHSIVAEIAARRLEPAVRQEIENLLGPGVSLASTAAWADGVALTKRYVAISWLNAKSAGGVGPQT